MSRIEALRVLDANANRAGEGLRTIEDVARLVREDVWAAEQLKRLRHELGAVVDCLPRVERLSARSTETDAGTQLHAATEYQRPEWAAIVTAAAERVAQSLRSLEEFSKVVDPAVAVRFKKLRYRTYDVLAEVEIRLRVTTNLWAARLYVLVDCQKPIEEFVLYLKQLAEAGVDWFQLRDKRLSDAELLSYARVAIDSVKCYGSSVIVNDRPDIALLSGAAGVHVGQEDLSIEDVRRIVGHKVWVGVSTHSIEQVRDAQQRGADYIGCGPTFPSDTKSFTEYPGIEFIKQVAAIATVPAFAIGGIHADNVNEVIGAGCFRVAVSSGIHAASEPTAVASELAKELVGTSSADSKGLTLQ